VSTLPNRFKDAFHPCSHPDESPEEAGLNSFRSDCSECPVRSNELLRDFSNEQASRFVCIFRRVNTQANQILYSEGSSPSHLFALRSGLVKIVKSLENGKERILRVIFPGAIFGLEALSGTAYSTAAVAFRDSEVCAVSRDEFFTFLQDNPDISLAAVRFLAGEVAQLSTQIGAMSFKDARKKVATLICSLVSPEQAETASPILLRWPFSTQETGEILELASETVSRTWTSLGSDGVIEKHGRKVVVLDLEKLESMARR
jgi:CRP/FNR family transcriptional regulator, polysaccharide utilization system transcription regulator